jgi:ribonuclease Z
LPKKAKAIKGLVPKLHYKLLTDGQSVTLEDGTVVTPEMVCDPPQPAQCFAFIFMPDDSFLQNFNENFLNTMFKLYTTE